MQTSEQESSVHQRNSEICALLFSSRKGSTIATVKQGRVTFQQIWIQRGCPARGVEDASTYGTGVVPTAFRLDDRVGLFWSPAPALVGLSPRVLLENRIDHGPSGLNRVLTGEERSIAGHGVAQ